MIPVTCIIPVRNGAATLERAVESAFAAGCDKVAMCDDVSTDDTLDMMQMIYNKHRDSNFRITIFQNRQARFGATVSRNYIISCPLFDGHLIIPLDCDDTLQDITPLRDAWQPGSWVYGDYYQVEGKQIMRIPGSPAGVLSRREVTGITFMFHKDDWLKVGGYDPDFAYCEDWAFQCNLTHHGVKPIYVETPVYTRYLKANGNERTSLAGEYWPLYKAMAQRKYPSLFQVNR